MWLGSSSPENLPSMPFGPSQIHLDSLDALTGFRGWLSGGKACMKGTAWHSTTQHDTETPHRDTAQHGLDGGMLFSPAQHTSPHNAARHHTVSTAQHIKAYHSTAQHKNTRTTPDKVSLLMPTPIRRTSAAFCSRRSTLVHSDCSN